MKKTILTTTALVSCLAFAGPTFANPTGATIVNGGVEIEGEGTASVAVTNTPGSIINWDSFSIQSGELVTFTQESEASAILNRVIGEDPSEIWGRLESNGRVFLINRNGIMFKAGARIDVAGLVASTLQLSDDDFLDGHYNFTDNGGDGLMTFEGDVKVWTGDRSDSGQIWLIARKITTSQQTEIDAPGGQVALAAGNTVSVVDAGLGRMEFQLATSASSTIEHLGAITTERGSAGLFADSILLGSYAGGGGSVIAEPETGETASISIIADRDVLIDEGALVDASGDGVDDGGSITIVAKNGSLKIHKDAGVHADGGSGGNGGTIGLTGHVVEIDTLTNGISSVTASVTGPGGEQGLVSINETGNHTHTFEEIDYTSNRYEFVPGGSYNYTLSDNSGGATEITTLSGGGFAVANSRAFYERFDYQGSNRHTEWIRDSYISVTTYDADGNVVGTINIGQDYTGGQVATTEDILFRAEEVKGIVPLSTGGFAVLWVENPQGFNGDDTVKVYFQTFSATGTSIGSPTLVSETYSGSIATTSENRFAVSYWVDGGLTSAVQYYDHNGSPAAEPDYLTEILADIWSDGDGGIIAVRGDGFAAGADRLAHIQYDSSVIESFLQLPDEVFNATTTPIGLIGGTIVALGWGGSESGTNVGRFDGNGNQLGDFSTLSELYRGSGHHQAIPLTNGGYATVGGQTTSSVGGGIVDVFSGDGSHQGSTYILNPPEGEGWRLFNAATGLNDGGIAVVGALERDGIDGLVVYRSTRTLSPGTVTGSVTGGMPNEAEYSSSPGSINGEWGLFQGPTDPTPDGPTDPIPDGFSYFSTDMQNAFQNLYAAIESGNNELALRAWQQAELYWQQQLEENGNTDGTDWDAIMAQSSASFKALVENSSWEDAAAEMRRLMDKMRGGDAAAFVETLTETERTLLRSEIQSQLTALQGIRYTAAINFIDTRQELDKQRAELAELTSELDIAAKLMSATVAIKGAISGPPSESLVQGTAANTFLENINPSLTSTVAQDYYWKTATGIAQGTTGALIAVGCTNCIDPEYQDTALSESGSLAMKFYSDINDPMFWVNVIAEYTGSNPAEAMDQAANTLNVLETTTLNELDAKIEALETLLGYLG